jgi:hypothetical protein
MIDAAVCVMIARAEWAVIQWRIATKGMLRDTVEGY